MGLETPLQLPCRLGGSGDLEGSKQSSAPEQREVLRTLVLWVPSLRGTPTRTALTGGLHPMGSTAVLPFLSLGPQQSLKSLLSPTVLIPCVSGTQCCLEVLPQPRGAPPIPSADIYSHLSDRSSPQGAPPPVLSLKASC